MRPFDSAGGFAAATAGMGLRRAAVRGAGASIFGAGASFFIQIAATVVLARILTPADFGVVAMVTTFSLYAGNFGLNGFTEAIIQREALDHWLASNIFWLNTAIGAAIAVGFAAAGPLMAAFYHDPQVAAIAAWMAIPMFLGTLSVVHLALLKRALRFTTTSVITVAGRAAMVAASIAFAIAGWGYWALVIGVAAQMLVTSGAAWWCCRWLPARPRRAAGLGGCGRFAANVFSHFTLSYFASNTDNVLVGWQFDAAALGFYKKAYDLFALPASQLVAPVGAVVVATLSRLNRDQEQFRRYFLSGMTVLALVGMAVGADFTLVGRDIVRLILGPGWGETGRIFTLFGPGIGIMLLYGTHGWIHLSIGRPDRWFRWGIVEFLVTVALFIPGLRFGPRGVALAWTASFYILFLPAFWYAGKPIGLGIAPVIAAVWKYFAAGVISGAAAYGLVHAAPLFGAAPGALGALGRAAWGSALVAVTYTLGVIALHRGLGPFRQCGSLLREILPAPVISPETDSPSRVRA
ncbi:MAG: lipopolysaccharide biosynthesis protein [Terriglobales bacterium]